MLVLFVLNIFRNLVFHYKNKNFIISVTHKAKIDELKISIENIEQNHNYNNYNENIHQLTENFNVIPDYESLINLETNLENNQELEFEIIETLTNDKLTFDLLVSA